MSKEDRERADKNGKVLGIEDLYWGCTYNAEKHKATENLKTPLRKDLTIMQRSWAVLRITHALNLAISLSHGTAYSTRNDHGFKY